MRKSHVIITHRSRSSAPCSHFFSLLTYRSVHLYSRHPRPKFMCKSKPASPPRLHVDNHYPIEVEYLGPVSGCSSRQAICSIHPWWDCAQGFRVGFSYNSHRCVSATSNHPSANDHPEVISRCLQTEVEKGRLIGPLDPAQFPYSHTSSLGAVPKKHSEKKWRLMYSGPLPP